jgi:large subunit ribosomal protein L31
VPGVDPELQLRLALGARRPPRATDEGSPQLLMPLVGLIDRSCYSGGAKATAATLDNTMKTGVHPEYVDAHVRCTCGNEFMTRSTKPEIHVEICSACHPFYTGRQKLVDTGGRVERFQRRVAKGRRAARASAGT